MKRKKMMWICLTCLLLNVNVYGYTKRDLLQKSISLSSLQNVLIANQKWVPYPAYSDRAGWDKLLGDFKEDYIAQGNKALSHQWRLLKATDYLEYERTGSRSTMEGPFDENIKAITKLFIAELAEGKGRFLDQIANGVYATCEMTSWSGVAHLILQVSKTPFPNHDEQIIDLYSGDVGSLFSWIYYFLHQDFDKLNPLISKRLKAEIQRKILDPYMNVNHLWWMGFNYKPGDMMNNWNPWCNSNVLQCFALIEQDPEKLAKAVYRTMTSTDIYINYNNEDGACEEGPAYWSHGAGKLYDYLKILHDITGGKVSIFNQPIIRNMGEYISRAYVGNGWVVNFADAPAKLRPEPTLIHRYGKAVNSTEMMQFAAFLNKDNKSTAAPFFGRDIFRLLQSVLYEDRSVKPLHNRPGYTWYPQTQVSFVRQGDLFFAAKGGYNSESHNHNDIGSFSLYLKDHPVFIDAGVGTYTRQTFSADRYSIWTMQSLYHNVPEVNGYAQRYGSQYKAEKPTFNANKKIFSLNLKNAYPLEAGIKDWERSYELKKDRLIVSDKFELQDAKKENRINFLVSGIPEEKVPGNITITSPAGKLNMEYDKSQFDINIDTILLDDVRLSNVWGERIYRISLQAKKATSTGKYQFTIKF